MAEARKIGARRRSVNVREDGPWVQWRKNKRRSVFRAKSSYLKELGKPMDGCRLNGANRPAMIGRRLAPIPVLFRKSSERNQKLDQHPDIEELDKEEEEKFYCANCGHLITTGRWWISMDSGHEHRFSNPAGMTFDIRCFKEAPGAVAVGEQSDEFTWFQVYDWQVALCRGCGAHLGWQFTGDEAPPVFFGLIGDRLTTQAPE